jgi:hypothetical protein
MGDPIRTALRVLNAIVVEGDADPSDVEELRYLAPELAHASADNLAFEVIRRVAVATSAFG